MARLILAPALLAVALLAAACAGLPEPGALPRPVILSPSRGAVVTFARLEVGVAVPADALDLRLEITLDGVDVSSRFHTPYRRMRSLGGDAVTTATLDLGGRAAGQVMLAAALVDGRGRRAETSATFEWERPAGELRVRVRESDAPVPARIFIEGREATSTPDFSAPGGDAIDPRRREAGRHFIDSADGDEVLFLAPGRYRVTAARGLEYDVARTEIDLAPGASMDVELAIERVVATPGWIGADLHVHAAPSVDSFVPLTERVAGYLAAGVEVLVGSDHHMLTDYAPTLAAEPGAADRLVSMIGVEAGLGARLGESAGHWTLFPFDADDNQAVRAWPRVPAREPADIYRVFRQGDATHPPAATPGVVELNHPRGIVPLPGADRRGLDGAAWFEAGGFRADAAIPDDPDDDTSPNAFLRHRDETGAFTNLDFDALELLNRFSFDLYRDVRTDWFALLAAGLRRTATANSDSHHRVLVGPGFPRNLVRIGDGRDTPATFDRERFVAAILSGAVVGTTGPVIDLTVNGSGPGDTLTLSDDPVTARLRVRAAPWIPVREVRLVVNGRVERRFDLDVHASDPVRLDTTVDIAVLGETWILAEAGEPLHGEPGDPGAVYRLVAPGFVPVAFTNPVHVVAAPSSH